MAIRFSIPLLSFIFHLSLTATAKEVALSKAQLCGKSPTNLCELEFENYQLGRKVRNLLYERQWLAASAESLTVGEFASTLGQLHWAGGALAGGLTTYNTALKNHLLDVSNETDAGVINNQTAIEMANGLSKVLAGINKQKAILSRNDKSKVNVFISFTGLATHWNDFAPKVHIAIKIGNEPAIVKVFQLDSHLKNAPLERKMNIQHAVHKGLRFLENTLKKYPPTRS